MLTIARLRMIAVGGAAVIAGTVMFPTTGGLALTFAGIALMGYGIEAHITLKAIFWK